MEKINLLKKVSFFVVLFVFVFNTVCFAGSNRLSSNNEQYGILANQYAVISNSYLLLSIIYDRMGQYWDSLDAMEEAVTMMEYSEELLSKIQWSIPEMKEVKKRQGLMNQSKQIQKFLKSLREK